MCFTRRRVLLRRPQTRLIADKDNDEEEDESNVTRLQGSNKTGSSLSGLRHIHSCPQDPLEFTFGKMSTLTFPSVGVL